MTGRRPDRTGICGDKQMEILYYSKNAVDAVYDQTVRWLSVDEYDVFRDHLKLCGQRILDEAEWKKAYAGGTVYCGLFVDDRMVARACVEKYSLNAWEVADVRTAKQYRGNGYACQVCAFVLNSILAHGKTGTIRTEEDNAEMKKVIEKLGFSVL